MSKLLDQAREMHERHQRQLAQMISESSVAEGRIRAKINGHRSLVRMSIEPDAVDPQNLPRLEEQVVEAVNAAMREIEEKLKASFGRVSILPSLIPDEIFNWDR
jgi:hypothetical protein